MTWYCQHGKRRNECKDCKGSSICVHGRRRIRCPQCLGSCICNHGRIRSQCHLCGGSSICFHGKRKSYCKQCGGLSFCPHGKRRGTKCKGCASDKHISFAAEDTVDLRSRNGSEVLLLQQMPQVQVDLQLLLPKCAVRFLSACNLAKDKN